MGDLKARFDPDKVKLTPDVARRIIVSDAAVGGRCRRCTYKVGLYTFTVGWFPQCPNCLKDRIEAVVADGEPLEGELGFTYGSVVRDVKMQDARMFGDLTVEMPRFFRCARCDDLKLLDDARYYVPAGEHSSPPYCQECNAALRAGGG